MGPTDGFRVAQEVLQLGEDLSARNGRLRDGGLDRSRERENRTKQHLRLVQLLLRR